MLLLCEAIVHGLVDEVGHAKEQEQDVKGRTNGADPETPGSPLGHNKIRLRTCFHLAESSLWCKSKENALPRFNTSEGHLFRSTSVGSTVYLSSGCNKIPEYDL